MAHDGQDLAFQLEDSTTIADLLTWSELRKGQIETAMTAYNAAVQSDSDNQTNNALANWQAYDSNHS